MLKKNKKKKSAKHSRNKPSKRSRNKPSKRSRNKPSKRSRNKPSKRSRNKPSKRSKKKSRRRCKTRRTIIQSYCPNVPPQKIEIPCKRKHVEEKFVTTMRISLPVNLEKYQNDKSIFLKSLKANISKSMNLNPSNILNINIVDNNSFNNKRKYYQNNNDSQSILKVDFEIETDIPQKSTFLNLFGKSVSALVQKPSIKVTDVPEKQTGFFDAIFGNSTSSEQTKISELEKEIEHLKTKLATAQVPTDANNPFYNPDIIPDVDSLPVPAAKIHASQDGPVPGSKKKKSAAASDAASDAVLDAAPTAAPVAKKKKGGNTAAPTTAPTAAPVAKKKKGVNAASDTASLPIPAAKNPEPKKPLPGFLKWIDNLEEIKVASKTNTAPIAGKKGKIAQPAAPTKKGKLAPPAAGKKGKLGPTAVGNKNVSKNFEKELSIQKCNAPTQLNKYPIPYQEMINNLTFNDSEEIQKNVSNYQGSFMDNIQKFLDDRKNSNTTFSPYYFKWFLIIIFKLLSTNIPINPYQYRIWKASNDTHLIKLYNVVSSPSILNKDELINNWDIEKYKFKLYKNEGNIPFSIINRKSESYNILVYNNIDDWKNFENGLELENEPKNLSFIAISPPGTQMTQLKKWSKLYGFGFYLNNCQKYEQEERLKEYLPYLAIFSEQIITIMYDIYARFFYRYGEETGIILENNKTIANLEDYLEIFTKYDEPKSSCPFFNERLQEILPNMKKDDGTDKFDPSQVDALQFQIIKCNKFVQKTKLELQKTQEGTKILQEINNEIEKKFQPNPDNDAIKYQNYGVIYQQFAKGIQKYIGSLKQIITAEKKFREKLRGKMSKEPLLLIGFTITALIQQNSDFIDNLTLEYTDSIVKSIKDNQKLVNSIMELMKDEKSFLQNQKTIISKQLDLSTDSLNTFNNDLDKITNANKIIEEITKKTVVKTTKVVKLYDDIPQLDMKILNNILIQSTRNKQQGRKQHVKQHNNSLDDDDYFGGDYTYDPSL